MQALFPILIVLLAIMSTQTGSALAKQLFDVWGPVGTTLVRITLAAIMLQCLWRPWKRLPDSHQWPALGFYGLALGAMNMLFYLAIQRVPLGIAVAFEILGPLTLAFITSHKRQDVLWGVCAVLGVALLLPIKTTLATTSTIDPIGLLCAIGAGLCWALYIWFGKRAGDGLHSGTAIALGMTVAAFVALPLGFVDVWNTQLPPDGLLPVLAIAIGVAILSSALPYSLEMIVLKQLPTQVFSVLMSLQPAMAALSGWVILHEQLLPIQWVAIGLIVVASIGNSLGSHVSEPVL